MALFSISVICSPYGSISLFLFSICFSKLATDEIRCPYCRTRQKGVLPYYEELGFPKINGVNDINPFISNKSKSSSYKMCEFVSLNTEELNIIKTGLGHLQINYLNLLEEQTFSYNWIKIKNELEKVNLCLTAIKKIQNEA